MLYFNEFVDLSFVKVYHKKKKKGSTMKANPTSSLLQLFLNEKSLVSNVRNS